MAIKRARSVGTGCRRIRRSACGAVAALVALVALFAANTSKADRVDVDVDVVSASTVVLSRPGYDYAAAAIEGGGTTKIWWCGNARGFDGDHVMYAETAGPLVRDPAASRKFGASARLVFSPARAENAFDSAHVCDPSVIAVDGKYYMYYGGIDVLKKRVLKLPNPTAIGVATSKDGLHWIRANGGKPIVSVVNSTSGKPNQYGVGQPSVVYVAPYFYMLFTDTTARGADPRNGAGQFVIRSLDPLFADFDELTAAGFQRAAENHARRDRSLAPGFSSDLAYLDCCRMFVIATNRPRAIELRFFDPSFRRVGGVATISGDWVEGPGFVRDAFGHIGSSTALSTQIRILAPVGRRLEFDTWDLAGVVANLRFDKSVQ